jgi:hypothetical protein
MGLPISLDPHHLIWSEGLKVLLLLRSGSNDDSEACRGKQTLCLLRMGAADNQGYEGESGRKIEAAQNLFHGFLFS